MSYSRNLAADLVWNAQSQSYVLAPSRIYTSYVELHDNTYYNCQTITHVDAANTPWVNNCMYGAFENCSNLQSVTNINSNVTNMQAAFMNCQKLVAAPILPPSVTTIDSIFYGCSNILTMPDIPASVTNMNYAFMYCSNLSSITTIPSGVNDLNYAFAYTNINTSPALPLNITNLTYTYAFCKNLNNAPIIPSNVSTLEGTFEGCRNLTGDIYVKSNQITNAAECFATTYLTKNIFIPFEYANGANTATKNAFEAAYPVNTISGTAHGTLTDNNGVISGFSENNYLWVEQTIPTPITEIEEVIKIHTNSITPSDPTYAEQCIAAGEPYVGIASIHIYKDGRLKIYISSNNNVPAGSGNDIASGVFSTLTVNANTDYWIKFTWDGTTYRLNVSTDGINYTDYIVINNSLPPAFNGKLGYGNDTGASYTRPFLGSIDLRNSYIKINGKKWWKGYVRPNGVVLKDIDGSKITINPTPADAVVQVRNITTGTDISLDDWSYTLTDNTAEIQGYTGSNSAVVVPSLFQTGNSIRAMEDHVIEYVVSKDGYTTVTGTHTVDGSQTINVNLEQIMCTFTVVPMPSDAIVTLTTFIGTQYYAWGPYRNSYVYTLSETPLAGDKLFTYDNGEMVYSPHAIAAGNIASVSENSVTNENGFGYERNSSEDIVIGPKQSGNSITVPWGTEVTYTVSKDHYDTVTNTITATTSQTIYVPIALSRHIFTINPTPADAAVQILVNGKLVNASNSDWIFTSDNLNGDIELQEYTGSNTVVVMPTSYETTNTITADYGSSIEWKVSKNGYVDKTDTLTLTADTTLTINLGDVLNVAGYEYTNENGVVTLTKYTGAGGDVETPLINEGA